MRVASLFTGAGGLDLGLEEVRIVRRFPHSCSTNISSTVFKLPQYKFHVLRGLLGILSKRVQHAFAQAGHTIIFQCESDPGAQQVDLTVTPQSLFRGTFSL